MDALHIAEAKIDESGLYDTDGELCEDINAVLCSFLDAKQSIDIFDIEPNKENFKQCLVNILYQDTEE